MSDYTYRKKPVGSEGPYLRRLYRKVDEERRKHRGSKRGSKRS